MKTSENGLGVGLSIGKLKFTSAADLFWEWNNSINKLLKSEVVSEKSVDSENLALIFGQSVNLFQNIQRLIMDEMIERSGTKDKEQFIRMVQVMVTRLLDSVSQVSVKDTWLHQQELIANFTGVLVNVLHFLKEYFGNYFDKSEKIPFVLNEMYKNEIERLSDKYKIKASEQSEGSSKLIELLSNHFDAADWLCRPGCSYNHFLYQKELLNVLIRENDFSGCSLRKLLYYFNFNCSSFVIYEFDRLAEIITPLPTKLEKITALRNELKTINQLPSKIKYYYDEDMPSLKEQVSTWIEEEIRYCEAGHFIQVPVNSNGEIENKIHTTLSVAKLSLLIRLLVVDKIIINRTIAPMLKTVSKMFSTLQREEISFGSLETKYHAPDKATIAVMKEMLQKWITILGKL